MNKHRLILFFVRHIRLIGIGIMILATVGNVIAFESVSIGISTTIPLALCFSSIFWWNSSELLGKVKPVDDPLAEPLDG